MIEREEVTTYLEMTAPSQLRAALQPEGQLLLMQAEDPTPELGRFLYSSVGGEWLWIDRLAWTYEEWTAFQAQPGFETWVLYGSGTPAGYFELLPEGNGRVEVASFGLLPRFCGKGMGGWLLSSAVRRAWDNGASTVWLHTSSFDHPHALGNYLARGFRIAGRETAIKRVPAQPIGPWPPWDPERC